jgi:hypothetical protein
MKGLIPGVCLAISLGIYSGCGGPEPTVVEVPQQTAEEAAAEAEAYELQMSSDS